MLSLSGCKGKEFILNFQTFLDIFFTFIKKDWFFAEKRCLQDHNTILYFNPNGR